jgi:hypothetical protein
MTFEELGVKTKNQNFEGRKRHLVLIRQILVSEMSLSTLQFSCNLNHVRKNVFSSAFKILIFRHFSFRHFTPKTLLKYSQRRVYQKNVT